MVGGAFVVLVLVNFAWFWPILTDELLTQQRVARPDLVLEMGVTMSRKQLALIAVGVALVVAVVAFLLTRDDDDKDSTGADPQPSASPSTSLPVVADETWCAGWQNLVATQGLYVAGPNPEVAANLLAAVDALQDLGVPESLDPSGYTELTAVLDDVHAASTRRSPRPPRRRSRST